MVCNPVHGFFWTVLLPVLRELIQAGKPSLKNCNNYIHKFYLWPMKYTWFAPWLRWINLKKSIKVKHGAQVYTYHTQFLWNFGMNTPLDFHPENSFLWVLMCFFRSWNYFHCLSLLSSSIWITSMCICRRERDSHPPFSFLFFLLHCYLFFSSLTIKTEDALLLHHNHSGMKIQSRATPEQNGKWVKTTSRTHWSLQISISQSIYFYYFPCFTQIERKAYKLY